MTSKLQVDVYVAPAIPAETGHTDPDKRFWSPISCTLIQGHKSAIIVDTPINIEQSEAYADWVAKTIGNKELKFAFITHAHGDHFLGFPVLKKRFPRVKLLATDNVARGIKESYRTSFEKIWPTYFPGGQLSPDRPVPESLPSSGEIDLDGHKLFAINVGHTDTAHASFLHVPDLSLVVAGDVVYGDCHQFLGEANTASKRREWLEALAAIEKLNPQIVVPGHKRATQIDGAYLISATREYIQAFERELELSRSAQDLFTQMTKLYPQRWNLFLIDKSCQVAWAKRQTGEH
jgi:glyoxylase-like metal-dependent hydrolase (beta-lactamase superfamily II)